MDGEEKVKGAVEGKETNRTNWVPESQLPSSDTGPGNPSPEHDRPTVAGTTPQASHELADQPGPRKCAASRRPLMPAVSTGHRNTSLIRGGRDGASAQATTVTCRH